MKKIGDIAHITIFADDTGRSEIVSASNVLQLSIEIARTLSQVIDHLTYPTIAMDELLNPRFRKANPLWFPVEPTPAEDDSLFCETPNGRYRRHPFQGVPVPVVGVDVHSPCTLCGAAEKHPVHTNV